MYNLSEFAFSDMVDCGAWLRRIAGAGTSMEEAADLVVSYLHQALRDDAGDPACELVRCFVTLPFAALEPELQQVARSSLGREPAADMRSFTLLATAGRLPAWNDRRRSAGDQAIPLVGEEMVAQSPMISQLITQFGLDVGSLLAPAPDPDVMRDLAQRTYDVFHVAEAAGSAHVQDQEDFVGSHGIRSVLGFGGVLPGGNLVAFVLFTRCAIRPEAASLFKTLALTAKLALMPFAGGPFFAPGTTPPAGGRVDTAAARLAAVEQLLEAYEAAAAEHAAKLERAKSDFLAVMSHEIRMPINGVIVLTGLMLDGPLSETQRHRCEGVRASGEALLGIVNNILDFSKIEAGRLELEAVDFDLRQALEDVGGLVAEAARAKGLELVVDCRPELPTTLRGDVGRLRQILLNLAANAVKFTQSGEVVLRASSVDEPAPGEVVVRFDVADTGIGIDPATAARLFDPFSQADGSTTRRYGGTGLGLAICRRLAEAMGGTIGLDSGAERGADFWVQLPFPIGEEPAPAPSATSPARAMAPAPEPQGTVLVVDDHAINQEVAKGILAKLGYRCDLAGDGVEALAALERRDYDAVLMDCRMPRMDGFEATAEIRRREGGVRRVPIVAMTANALVEDRERCMATGMDDYVSKPVKAQELDAILARLLFGIEGAGRPPAPRAVPAPAAVDAAGVLDLEQFNLVRELGDFREGAAFLHELVEDYLKDAARQLDDLRRVASGGELEALRIVAHGLKGSSATMGAKCVAVACEALERVAVEGRAPAPDAVEQVSVELERAAVALRSNLP